MLSLIKHFELLSILFPDVLGAALHQKISNLFELMRKRCFFIYSPRVIAQVYTPGASPDMTTSSG